MTRVWSRSTSGSRPDPDVLLAAVGQPALERPAPRQGREPRRTTPTRPRRRPGTSTSSSSRPPPQVTGGPSEPPRPGRITMTRAQGPQPPRDDGDELLTLEVVAAHLKVPAATLRKWRAQRTGPTASASANTCDTDAQPSTASSTSRRPASRTTTGDTGKHQSAATLTTTGHTHPAQVATGRWAGCPGANPGTTRRAEHDDARPHHVERHTGSQKRIMGVTWGSVRSGPNSAMLPIPLTCVDEPAGGLEPPTARLQVGCATSCATPAWPTNRPLPVCHPRDVVGAEEVINCAMITYRSDMPLSCLPREPATGRDRTARRARSPIHRT